MRILFWNLERVCSTSTRQVRVRIELQRNLDSYAYMWSAIPNKSNQLSKKELHQLDMRVAKHIAVLNEDAPKHPDRQILYAAL